MKVISRTHNWVLLQDTVRIGLFTFFMIMAAQIRIPLFFTPVPITLQTFVLFLSILFLGRKAYLCQLGYVFLGILGLPVFSNFGSGPQYFFGPTGGYIAGFLVASASIPHILPPKKSYFKIFAALVLASIIYFSLGIVWLVFFYNFSMNLAFICGLLPFIIGDLFKASLAAFIFIKKYR